MLTSPDRLIAGAQLLNFTRTNDFDEVFSAQNYVELLLRRRENAYLVGVGRGPRRLCPR
jgi:hypothetical protein